jgi:hypothetical protein
MTMATKIDGTVPGLTWSDFIKNYSDYVPGGNAASILSGANINGLGEVGRNVDNAQATVGGGEGNFGGFDSERYTTNGAAPAYSYSQGLDDGTTNWFTEGPNGEVESQNRTTNDDGWFQKMLDIVAPIAISSAGGIVGGISALGGAASAVGGAESGLAAGEYGLDAGLGGQSWLSGAGALGSGAVNVASGTLPEGTDLTLQNLSGALGEGGTDASLASDWASMFPEQAASPSWYQQLLDTAKSYGFGNGPVGSIQNIANGTGQVGDYLSAASTANSADGVLKSLGGTGADGEYSSVANYDPTSSFINPTNAADTTQQIANNGTSLISNSSGSSGSSNPFQALVNLYNNGLTGGSASDYYSLASLLGSGASALLGSNAANNAAQAQISAANNSTDLARGIYNSNTALNAPFVAAGTNALGQQSSLLGLNGTAAQTAAQGAFTSSPGYQFRLDQGTKALQNSASAAGGLYSGRAAKDLTNYAQGAASSEYGNYTSGLQSLINTGQASANQQAANGNALVSNVTGNNAAIGNATAAGTVGSTNAVTGALGQILNQGASSQLLNLLKNQGSNGYYSTGTI